MSVKDSNAEELIAISRYVVKRLRKIWIGSANNISKNATSLNGILTGWRTRFIELLVNSYPTTKMDKENIKEVIYSNLPYPKGCFSSAGRLASLKLKIVTMEETVSVKLCIVSAVIDILFRKRPTISSIISIVMLIINLTIPPNN